SRTSSTARWAAVVLLAALVALSVPATAGRGPRDPRAERIVEALLVWRLVDELNLSEPQIARIFPRIKALKELRIELGRRKITVHRELRDLMQQQPRNEEEIQAKITELDQLRGQIEFRRQGILREINAALTLEQRAQFALITETFEVETIRMLEELRLIVEQRRRR
ncbi:MAG TPA: hypothetical protein VFH67_03420, partial [bacterium]|nr:hypothetical protein [bacterium]